MSYGWATVFTLAAWFAGLVIDVNVRVGDLGLRTVLPVIVMGCCVMKYINIDCNCHLSPQLQGRQILSIYTIRPHCSGRFRQSSMLTYTLFCTVP